MKKMNLLAYLDEQIEKKINNYDIALDWDTKNHTIEIIVRLFAENNANLEIDDAEGIISEEEIIEFEDGILLYDPKKSVIDAEEYLAVISYEGKKGLPKAKINGIVDYLQEVLDEGQSDLLDFLDETNEEAVFELHWDAQKLEQLTEKYQQQATEYLPYPAY
ncbi:MULTISPECIES: DUF3013 family protein [unclassified Enterococcus]|jgi:hypothetical protein|uniref:DUF3013 family protein n=1 Tax=unclassified Enterococcus TaxID=2608891 RepID=UPI003D2CF773